MGEVGLIVHLGMHAGALSSGTCHTGTDARCWPGVAALHGPSAWSTKKSGKSPGQSRKRASARTRRSQGYQNSNSRRIAASVSPLMPLPDGAGPSRNT